MLWVSVLDGRMESRIVVRSFPSKADTDSGVSMTTESNFFCCANSVTMSSDCPCGLL